MKPLIIMKRLLAEFGAIKGSELIQQAIDAMDSITYSLMVRRPDLSYSP